MKEDQVESKKERKQRYDNRPRVRKAPKGEKYKNTTNKPISKTGGRKK